MQAYTVRKKRQYEKAVWKGKMQYWRRQGCDIEEVKGGRQKDNVNADLKDMVQKLLEKEKVSEDKSNTQKKKSR